LDRPTAHQRLRDSSSRTSQWGEICSRLGVRHIDIPDGFRRIMRIPRHQRRGTVSRHREDHAVHSYLEILFNVPALGCFRLNEGNALRKRCLIADQSDAPVNIGLSHYASSPQTALAAPCGSARTRGADPPAPLTERVG
jgi:hypothetical protein